MENVIRQKATMTAVVYGAVPCIVGLGIALTLRWSGTVWLSNGGAFWPIICVATSAAVLVGLFVSSSKDRTARFWGWVVLAWTWAYVPLWATAREIPQSSAVVRSDGSVHLAAGAARHPSDRVWLLSGRAGAGIVHNVAGAMEAHAVDITYRHADWFIAQRADGEDLAPAVQAAAATVLAQSAEEPRTIRAALFDKGAANDRLIAKLCLAAVPGEPRCPLKLTLSPQVESTLPGAVWSKFHTEKEALEERHVPSLTQLLTQDSSRVVDQPRVFATFMQAATTAEALTKVARKSSLLDGGQFDAVIQRLLDLPGCGSEVIDVLNSVNRLTGQQRRDLRDKVLRQAGLALIAASAASLRLADADLAQLAPRMRAAELAPGDAVLMLEKLGDRLPVEAQREAVTSIVKAGARHALSALRYVNFSQGWRDQLVRKVVADATPEDFEAVRLTRQELEDLLAPAEMRLLTAAAVRRGQTSPQWLSLAVRLLPVRAMTLQERKTVLDGLMFESVKTAMEFVSEHRHLLAAEDVNEVTVDYSNTVAPDFCLHLSHRNKNRKTDYFSDAQLKIFRKCAEK
jgi:hypothetical protein